VSHFTFHRARRRVIALAAAGATVLTIAGCGDGSSDSAASESGSGGTATLVSIQSVTDQGVMQDFVKGFEASTKEAGMKSNVVVLTDPSTYSSTLESVSARSKLVFTTFPPMIQAVEEVAPKHKDVDYVLLDARLDKPQDNVQELFFRENESSYLGGIVAGMMTQTKKVGFLGAIKQDVIDRYLVGFNAGVKSIDPSIQLCYAYVGSLSDPALGKQFATTMYGQGVDIIHAATAGTQVGVYQAAEEQKKFLVSADVDVRDLAPNYGLTATGPDFAGAAKVAVGQFASDKFKTGLQVYGLADGAVRILPYNDDLVPQEVQDAVAKAQQDIIDGTITVPDDKDVDSVQNCS
jgi:basic membrane protein A